MKNTEALLQAIQWDLNSELCLLAATDIANV
jgi:hypothetical protein